jgi:dTDP-4-dehydrorhamnose reductase
MTRLLVTGGSGYLGAYLLQSAAALGWDVHGTFFSRPIAASHGNAHQLDLGQHYAVEALVARLRPDAIIHTACSNRDSANIAAIEPAARHLADAAHQHGTRLVHLSTDLVFDGEHAPYDDTAPLAPKGAYGRAKAAAEAVIAAHCPSAAIARPSLIWALEPHDLSAALLELAAHPDLAGPFNLGGPQALSRWNFGLKLLEALGLPRGGNLLPGIVAETRLERARDLTLHCDRARQMLNTQLRSVDERAARPRSRQPRYCEG